MENERITDAEIDDFIHGNIILAEWYHKELLRNNLKHSRVNQSAFRSRNKEVLIYFMRMQRTINYIETNIKLAFNRIKNIES